MSQALHGPYAYNPDDIVASLRRLGYVRHGDPPADGGRILPPEHLIACMVYSRDHRWMSAVAVVLCRADIDWDLMVRTAVAYGFAGTLRGMIEGVRAEGRLVGGRALEPLSGYQPVKPERVREVLDICGC